MALSVREMTLDETQIRIDYFHKASTEYLEILGVNPTQLPTPNAWQDMFADDYTRPIEQRIGLHLIWLLDGIPVGMSSADNIEYGEQAFMHLHVLPPEKRHLGIGTVGVQKSVAIYFDRLNLKRLYCQPNAFNVAPNRVMQKAGFRYIKTYETKPGPINTYQAVTQWMMERP